MKDGQMTEMYQKADEGRWRDCIVEDFSRVRLRLNDLEGRTVMLMWFIALMACMNLLVWVGR